MLNGNYMNGKPRTDAHGKPQEPDFDNPRPGSFGSFRRPGKRPGTEFTPEENEEIKRRFGNGGSELDAKLARWAHFH